MLRMKDSAFALIIFILLMTYMIVQFTSNAPGHVNSDQIFKASEDVELEVTTSTKWKILGDSYFELNSKNVGEEQKIGHTPKNQSKMQFMIYEKSSGEIIFDKIANTKEKIVLPERGKTYVIKISSNYKGNTNYAAYIFDDEYSNHEYVEYWISSKKFIENIKVNN